MASEKKIYRYTAGGSGSSTQVDDMTVVREKEGFILHGANYLLGRLPVTNNEFEHWPPTKRIVVGYPLWLIVLPIWPLVIVIVLLMNHTIKQRIILTYFLLGLVVILWFWLLLSLSGILK